MNQKERGVKGMIRAIEDGCDKLFGEGSFKKIILKTSSIVTDGAKCNTGEKWIMGITKTNASCEC